jgi:hypothetical protein
MRWTLERRKTSDAEADGKIVWSWRPDAGAKFSREANLAKVTGQERPVPGEHDISRKPSRRECRLIAAYLWLLTRVLFVAHAAAGALRTRHSLRPLLPRRDMPTAQLGRIAPRESKTLS